MGESGSPCRRPRLWIKGKPGSPLTRILVEVVESNKLIRSHHLLPNPTYSMPLMYPISAEHVLLFSYVRPSPSVEQR